MAEKWYKSYKFSVEQVHLMEQLIETSMTESEVAAGFKQIRDMRTKRSSTTTAFPSVIKPNSRNEVVETPTPYRQVSPSSHRVLKSSPESQNRSQASPSSNSMLESLSKPQNSSQASPSSSSSFKVINPNSGDVTVFSTPTHNSTRLSPSSTSSTPTASTPKRRSPRRSVMNSTKSSEAKFDNSPQRTRGMKRKGPSMQTVAGRRGKPGTSHSSFVLTDADRNLYSTEVIDLMARSVSDVAKEISVFMTKNNYKIKQITDSNPDNLYYSYCSNWFNSPNTVQKQKICGIYQWYVAELKKIKGNIDNNADSVENNSSVDESFPALNLETEAFLDGLFKSFISDDKFEPQNFDAVGIAAEASKMMGGASVTPAQVSNVFFERFYSARENCQPTEAPESTENNDEPYDFQKTSIPKSPKTVDDVKMSTA